MAADRNDGARGLGARWRLLAIPVGLLVLAAGLVLALPDDKPTAEAHPPWPETYTYEVEVEKTREVPVYKYTIQQVRVPPFQERYTYKPPCVTVIINGQAGTYCPPSETRYRPVYNYKTEYKRVQTGTKTETYTVTETRTGIRMRHDAHYEPPPTPKPTAKPTAKPTVNVDPPPTPKPTPTGCTPGTGEHRHGSGSTATCHAGKHSCGGGEHPTSTTTHGHVSDCHPANNPPHSCPGGQHHTSKDAHGHVSGCHAGKHSCGGGEHPTSTTTHGHVSGCHPANTGHQCPTGYHHTSKDAHGHVSGCHPANNPPHSCPGGQHHTSKDAHGHVSGCHAGKHSCGGGEHPTSTTTHGHVSGCHPANNPPHQCPTGQHPTSTTTHGHVSGCHKRVTADPKVFPTNVELTAACPKSDLGRPQEKEYYRNSEGKWQWSSCRDTKQHGICSGLNRNIKSKGEWCIDVKKIAMKVIPQKTVEFTCSDSGQVLIEGAIGGGFTKLGVKLGARGVGELVGLFVAHDTTTSISLACKDDSDRARSDNSDRARSDNSDRARSDDSQQKVPTMTVAAFKEIQELVSEACKADPSASACAEVVPPGPASGLKLAAGDKQVAVSWSASADTPAAGFGYRVQWKTAAQTWDQSTTASQFEDLEHGDDLATSYAITGLSNGVAHSVRVAAFNDHGFSAWITGTGTPTAKPNSAATGVPSISGTVRVGETLTAGTSGIADADGLGVFAYQWSADSSAISGATSASYTLVAADEGKAISVAVSFTDGAGNAESVTSSPTAAVTAKPNSAATGVPSISGTVQVGETLTAGTSGIADADGLGVFAYQWSGDSSAISGATSATYTLVAADEGKAISVAVSFTDGAGNAESVTSSPTAAVTAAEDSDDEDSDDEDSDDEAEPVSLSISSVSCVKSGSEWVVSVSWETGEGLRTSVAVSENKAGGHYADKYSVGEFSETFDVPRWGTYSVRVFVRAEDQSLLWDRDSVECPY